MLSAMLCSEAIVLACPDNTIETCVAREKKCITPPCYEQDGQRVCPAEECTETGRCIERKCIESNPNRSPAKKSVRIESGDYERFQKAVAELSAAELP
jgi:hypothetical protein